MAKSMTVGKRENEKKRLAKREEKLKKKESKKLSGSSNSFEDMIAYVEDVYKRQHLICVTGSAGEY